MENEPFEDIFPIKHGDIPASYVSLFQPAMLVYTGYFCGNLKMRPQQCDLKSSHNFQIDPTKSKVSSPPFYCSPVEVGSLSHYLRQVLAPSQVVVSDFWTISTRITKFMPSSTKTPDAAKIGIWMTQLPEVSALGLGGFVFANGDKLGAWGLGSDEKSVAMFGLFDGWHWLRWIGEKVDCCNGEVVDFLNQKNIYVFFFGWGGGVLITHFWRFFVVGFGFRFTFFQEKCFLQFGGVGVLAQLKAEGFPRSRCDGLPPPGLLRVYFINFRVDYLALQWSAWLPKHLMFHSFQSSSCKKKTSKT